MELLQKAVDLVLHLDKHLAQLVTDYGATTHWILFAVVFCETGLVVTPFLPGDSLLFAAGALAALDTPLQIGWLWVLLTVAAIVGDTVNYSIGKRVGVSAFKPGNRVLRQEYLDRTHAFFEKHGPKTIVLARFIPIIRTFAPLVAGVARMNYRVFLTFSILGGTLWIWSMLLTGYFLGRYIPGIEKHIELVILTVIFLSILPAIIEYVRSRGRVVEPPL